MKTISEAMKKLNEVKEVAIPTKNGQEFIEYNFDEEDVKFIKSLLGDNVDVVLSSNDGNNKIDLKLAETKYIDSGIINFKSELYDEIEKYVKNKQPNAKLEVNNTGSTIWLRQEDFTKAIRPTTKIR